MRTITAAQQGVLDNGNQAEWVRVQTKDSGGTWRDLTTYPGFNAVKSVTWTEQIDQPHATFTVELYRELYLLSLSPYVTASALNRGFNPAASYAALLAVNRELKIEVAIVPMDMKPSSGDWFEVFHGRIDTLDPGKSETVELAGRDLGGRLAQQYIKYERVYSLAATGGNPVALRVWEANQVYALNEYLLPASRGDSDPGLDKFLKCSQAGTSGTTEPVWTTGSAQVDGTAKWDYVGAPIPGVGQAVEGIMQNLLDDNKAASDPSVTLYTPTSPSWAITEYIQQREFTLDALRALAQQIGWDVRYKWRSGTSQFELTFYQPTRTSPSVDFTFGPSDYETPTQLKVDIATIRNSIRVWYGDASDLWPDGTPKRKVVEVSDSSSITKYGELWMEIQEDQTSQINSSTEANTLANAALSDLKEPTAELDVPLCRGFPWVELNDYYTFSANDLQFDADQSLAVVQFQHTSQGGKGLKTTLQTRGLPTIGTRSHLDKRVNPKVPPKFRPHQQVQYNGAKTPALSNSSVVGGQHLLLTQTFDKNQLPEEYEHHVYPSSGTTLSSSTLAAITRDRHFTPAHLIAGKQYYHRVVPRYRNADRLVRMQPSIEQGFLAGRAFANHITDGIALGSYPLNGGFETRQDTSGFPDWWTPNVGTLGVDFAVMEDGNGISGGRYMKIISNGSTNPELLSAQLPITNESASGTRLSGQYRFRAMVKTDGANVSGGDNLWIAWKGVDYAGVYHGENGLFSVASDSNPGIWSFVSSAGKFGFSSTRSVYIRVFTDHAGAHHGQTFYIDELRFDYIGTSWYVVNVGGGAICDSGEAIPNFANGWQDASQDDAPDCYYNVPGFRRDVTGYIEIVGRVKSGAIGDVPIFTLPASFRPLVTQDFVVMTDQGPGWLQVQQCGDVCLRAGSDGWVDFGYLRFPTFPYT